VPGGGVGKLWHVPGTCPQYLFVSSLAVQQEAVGLGRERREGRTVVALALALALTLAVLVAVIVVVAIVADAALLQLAVRFGTLA